MMDVEELQKLMEYHAGVNTDNPESVPWKIQESPLEGRGLFATRDIKVGEIILIDNALVNGPRASISTRLHCVICYKSKFKACSKGCGLPVCSLECENTNSHKKECNFIREHRYNFEKIIEPSTELFRALTPIRAFLLDDKKKEILLKLVSHNNRPHGFELELIKPFINLQEHEERSMRKICEIFDANAFEIMIETKEQDEDVCLRGIFPLAAIMNHCCVPNTTHLFDKKQNMLVKSTVAIAKGSEILTTYTTLLWSTAARRHHLSSTKHFYCNCKRCEDPIEFGSRLSALKCTSATCIGVLYPIDALESSSKWKCDFCGFLVTKNCIAVIQSALGSLLRTIDVTDAMQLIDLMKNRIDNVVPKQSQIAVELKCRIIWMLGHTTKYSWNDISTENLKFKSDMCRDLLQVIAKLNLGQCKLKGLLLYELYRTQMEINDREIKMNEEKYEKTKDEMREYLKMILMEACEILKHDFRAPKEVLQYYEKNGYNNF